MVEEWKLVMIKYEKWEIKEEKKEKYRIGNKREKRICETRKEIYEKYHCFRKEKYEK